MKHFKFTFLLFVLMSMISLDAFPSFSSTKVEVDGLYYYLDHENSVAQVTSKPNGYYTGDIVIPTTIDYNSDSYSVTSIGSSAFSWCTGLTSLEIPSNVTSIGTNAFRQCTGLTSVEIPCSVTSIGSSAFFGCSGLNSIDLQNGVISIGDYAFTRCTGLTSIEIPSSVTNIDTCAFSGCTKLAVIIVESGNTAYDSRNNCNAIIETGSNTLIAGCKSTVIPNSVTSIGTGAFASSALSSIDIPSSVTSIGTGAFASSALTSIDIPSSVTNIGGSAFSGCSGLTSIKISSSVTSISVCAFEWCTSLISIEIPSSVTSIGNRAFYYCTGLTSIKIPSSVTSIGREAFYDCTALTSIENLSSVTSIGSGAFEDTPWYNSKPDGLLYIGKVAYRYKGTIPAGTSIVLEDGTTSICAYAFNWCTGLTSIEIPTSVTSIGNSAFWQCTGLTSIDIPNSVTIMGNSVFQGCNSLTAVKVGREAPIFITSNVFSNRANATLFVPAGCKAAYEAADYWKEFKEIDEYTEMTMGFNGIATYSCNLDLDFTDVSGLKAYIASGFSPSTGNLMLSRVYRVPAGEGLLLKGDADIYDIPSASVDEIYANLLVGVPTATTVSPTDGDYTNFILSKENSVIGFHPLASAGEISANKAYLQLPTSALPAAEARGINLVFDDEEETTGISTSLNNREKMVTDKAVFDLQGRRVEKPTRGLYIKGGKKYIKK